MNKDENKNHHCENEQVESLRRDFYIDRHYSGLIEGFHSVDIEVSPREYQRYWLTIRANSTRKEHLPFLLEKKPDWQEIQQVLQDNGITTLYHFTDISNIESIKLHGGLYSWAYCEDNGITIPFSGGGSLSRKLDGKYFTGDYVRLSFCSDHPMKYWLEQKGRNIVLLKISVDVASFRDTQFSDINATDSLHKLGGELNDLQRINFNATKQNYVRNDDPDFKPHQAEVLVKTWIPLEYITNINQF